MKHSSSNYLFSDHEKFRTANDSLWANLRSFVRTPLIIVWKLTTVYFSFLLILPQSSASFFAYYFDVFLLQPFVIFVVLLDINVSIDSLTLDSPYERCRDTSFGDRTPNQNVWRQLANSFVFYGIRSVFNIIYPKTIHFCQGAMLWQRVK
jgi:hypothetical protein